MSRDQQDYQEKVPYADRKPRKRCRQVSVRARLRFLEDQLRHQVSAPGDDVEISDEEFLANFRTAQEQGLFRHEPDFPQALAAYEAAMEAARNDPGAGYLPPPEFMPHAPEVSRRRAWRVGRPNGSVMKASMWIHAISQRVYAGEPPLSLAEWEQFKCWLRGNRRLLARLEKRRRERGPSAWWEEDAQDVLGLWERVKEDDGKRFGSHELAKEVRTLYARYAQRLRDRAERRKAEGRPEAKVPRKRNSQAT